MLPGFRQAGIIHVQEFFYFILFIVRIQIIVVLVGEFHAAGCKGADPVAPGNLEAVAQSVCNVANQNGLAADLAEGRDLGALVEDVVVISQFSLSDRHHAVMLLIIIKSLLAQWT